MKVNKTALPKDSLVLGFLPADYHDAYSCTVHNGGELSAEDLQAAFWTDMPGWVELLFKLRNLLVRPFGLAVDFKGGLKEVEKCIRAGAPYRIMSVAAKDAAETVLRLNDKHLEAFFSIRLEEGGAGGRVVHVSTMVNFHNRLGRVYFICIRPFHGLVVKSMLRRAISKALAGSAR